jgi:hypothetical protein
MMQKKTMKDGARSCSITLKNMLIVFGISMVFYLILVNSIPYIKTKIGLPIFVEFKAAVEEKDNKCD